MVSANVRRIYALYNTGTFVSGFRCVVLKKCDRLSSALECGLYCTCGVEYFGVMSALSESSNF